MIAKYASPFYFLYIHLLKTAPAKMMTSKSTITKHSIVGKIGINDTNICNFSLNSLLEP